MGCYGIGLPRLLSVIVEVNHDKEGIVWPQSVAPFDIHLLALENSNQVKKVSEKIYKDLQKSNIEVLYDDREEKTAGQKLIDTDLIGIPWRIVVSERSLSKNCVEVKKRDKKKVSLICPSKIKNLKF
jgi:prolyl-tRNA synthetase